MQPLWWASERWLGDSGLDVALAVHPGIAAVAFEGASRLIQKLLLPGIDLVRMNLIALRQNRQAWLYLKAAT